MYVYIYLFNNLVTAYDKMTFVHIHLNKEELHS